MDAAEKAFIKVFGQPTPKQELFYNAKTRYVGYGGAKGGGKSHAIRAKATRLAFIYPGIQILIVRRSLPELRENHTNKLRMAYNMFPQDARPSYNSDEKAFSFPWGSRIKLGYCDTEDDVLQYQGQEYDVIFLDEATQLSETQFAWIDACVRGTNGYPKRTYITCNPGGVGHAWVKRLFVDQVYRGKEDSKDYTFIQAKVWDNTPLLESYPDYVRAIAGLKRKYHKSNPTEEMVKEAMWASGYVKQLANLPSDELREAWLNGNWNVFSGQYFGEFLTTTHVCDPLTNQEIKSLKKSVALDYGLDMLAVIWVGVNHYGQSYIYREYCEKNLTVSSAAKMILEKTPTDENIREFYAPPDLWNRRQDTGRSAADIFAENGVPLIKAGNDRVSGWRNVKEYFKLRDGQPRLTIANTCKELIRCIPLLQHDTKKLEDVATEPHDITHSPDALRYWCSRRQLTPDIQQEQIADPFHLFKEKNSNDISQDYFIGGYRN